MEPPVDGRVGHIYKICNNITGKIYVGQTLKTIEDRFTTHKKNCRRGVITRLYSSMRKHGENAFHVELIGDYPINVLSERETHFILLLRSNDPLYGYNMTTGGERCSKMDHWSEEDKKILYAQQEENRKKYWMSTCGVTHFIHTERGRAWLKQRREQGGGRGKRGTWVAQFGEEKASLMKQNLSEIQKRRGTKPPNAGFHGRHTDETKEKLSKFRIGKTYEELYGEDRASSIKANKVSELKRRHHNNRIRRLPDKLAVIEELRDNYLVKVADMYSMRFGLYFIRQTLREIGIDNYQKFKDNVVMNSEGWVTIFNTKIEKIRSKYGTQ